MCPGFKAKQTINLLKMNSSCVSDTTTLLCGHTRKGERVLRIYCDKLVVAVRESRVLCNRNNVSECIFCDQMGSTVWGLNCNQMNTQYTVPQNYY